jgi:hypothetical protein
MPSSRVFEFESFFDFSNQFEDFDAILVNPSESREHIDGFFTVTVGV